jgi:hypothetical protein
VRGRASGLLQVVWGGENGSAPAAGASTTGRCAAGRERQGATVSVPHFGHDVTVSGTQYSQVGHVRTNGVSAPTAMTRAQMGFGIPRRAR